jgi:hypothetical protein
VEQAIRKPNIKNKKGNDPKNGCLCRFSDFFLTRRACALIMKEKSVQGANRHEQDLFGKLDQSAPQP